VFLLSAVSGLRLSANLRHTSHFLELGLLINVHVGHVHSLLECLLLLSAGISVGVGVGSGAEGLRNADMSVASREKGAGAVFVAVTLPTALHVVLERFLNLSATS
jgi:hypothetical protein